MGEFIGAIMFLVIAALSILQKVKQAREEEEIRRAQGNRPSYDDLPDETRRMIYGDRVPTATLEEVDEEEATVSPIPVAREVRERSQRPVPPRPAPARPQPQTPRQVVMEQPRRPQPERPKPRMPQRPAPVEYASQESAQDARRREVAEAQKRLERAHQMQQRYRTRSRNPAGKPRSGSDLLAVLLRHPNGVRAGIIFSEVMGPPKGMQ